MIKYIGYKITHDSGFAPNPFHGYLTLATCKPAIRRTKVVGDWVAGFASKTLVGNSKHFQANISYGGLIYLMKIEEVMTLAEYFNDPRFADKKPLPAPAPEERQCGDNIYYLDGSGNYCQQMTANSHNAHSEIEHDLSGINVLISRDMFYYFGKECPVPDGGWKSIGMRLSAGRTFLLSQADVENMLTFLRHKGFEPGVSGTPCILSDDQSASPDCSPCYRPPC